MEQILVSTSKILQMAVSLFLRLYISVLFFTFMPVALSYLVSYIT